MKFLLDSNVIIDGIMARVPALRERMATCDEDDMVTSAIAYAEVAHGSMHGKPPPIDILDAFLVEIPVLPFDDAAGRAFAILPLERGRFDRLIAAHALALDLTLVTSSTADFADISGLRVENWTQ